MFSRTSSAPLRFTRCRYAAFAAVGCATLCSVAWTQFSSAAPQRPRPKVSKRAKPASRSGSPLERVAPRLRKPITPRSILVRPVLNQSFQAQVLPLGAPDYPPAIDREFRAAWVATVYNMDWPSRDGLSAAEQKAQAIAILDRARELNLNALIWQVRPMCDAFYRSDLEPWSRFLTGTPGRDPGYDPLAFIVEEAHKRGLELHAWFNPYRAAASAHTDLPSNHIARKRPDLTVRYGKWLWLDPGRVEVRRHTRNVILDVVRRYDIDAVHLDDYFYPYVEKDATGQAIPFGDDASYNKYLQGGGSLTRASWRRENVNTLIRELHQGIGREKKWVRFGVSPFGIWRPGHPSSVRGMDAYSAIYADSRLWLREGWVDYWVPQLYWALDAPQQGYRELLQWWANENVKNRHLWPGHNAQRIGAASKAFAAEEITEQIRATREQDGATGDVLFSARVLLRNPENINAKLKQFYARPALAPATPWLDAKAPAAPQINGRVNADSASLRLEWKPGDSERVANWAIQQRFKLGDGTFAWATTIVPGVQTGTSLPLSSERMPDRVAVSAVDRVGNQSAPVAAVLK
jgi:uncharacterized lipoprotein YddW (UPF0748 family)